MKFKKDCPGRLFQGKTVRFKVLIAQKSRPAGVQTGTQLHVVSEIVIGTLRNSENIGVCTEMIKLHLSRREYNYESIKGRGTQTENRKVSNPP